jgi:DNA-binding transcriptional ArsR family regulator
MKIIQETTELFKTLSGSNRLRIVCLLCKKGEMKVSDISDELQLEQSATSHQLSKLRDEEIITSERRGQEIFYKLNNSDKARMAQKLITDCGCLGKKTQ